MKKKLSVTIGIPAYNEEANIGYLIEDILKQKQDYFVVADIIISSDGSTDNTKKIIKDFRDKRIKFIDNKRREGQSSRQNQIMDETKTDILVLINADINLKDSGFLSKLLFSFKQKGADLVSCNLVTNPAKTFIEKVLRNSFLFKNNIYESHNAGNNLYTCHGAARGFSKRLYKTMRFKESGAEDAYSYLYAKKHDFIYVYARNAIALLKLPENMTDHKKQSIRFFQSKKILYQEFGKDFIDKEYKLPLKKTMISYFSFFMKYPLEMSVFIFIVLYMKIQALCMNQVSNTWDIANSSKAVRNI